MTNEYVLATNDDGELAVRTVNATESSSVTSTNDIITRTEDGKLAVRVVGAGGGGGDTHNKGYFADQAALEEAYPTAEAGDWAIVGETDTVWVWDEDGSAWVDTDTKGEVTPDMIIVKSLTMPSADTTPAGAVYQYIGATNATYTHGYIYENVKTATYTGTVSFGAATLSGTTVTCSGDDFANFLTEAGADPTPIVSGTMTYEADANGWRLVGKDSNDNTVTTFIEYVEDYEDAGFVFTGTPQDGDVVAFTCTVEEASATYAWTRIDVQPSPVIPDPLPSQTGNAGKFLTTDGTDASWSDKPLVNTATGANSLTILGTASTAADTINIGRSSSVNNKSYAIAIGNNAQAKDYNAIAIGRDSDATYSSSIALGNGAKMWGSGVGVAVGIEAGNYPNATAKCCTCIGAYAKASAPYAIEINASDTTLTNSEQGTLCVGLRHNNSGVNYKLLDSDGTIPTDRFTTTPSADGTYYATLSISSGTATRSWGTINALVNKATGTESLGILSSTFSYTYSTVCGSIAYASGNNATVVGYNSVGNTDAVAVGYQADTKQGGVSIGKWAGEHSNCGARSVYIGQSATGSSSATDGIAIGYWVQAKAQHAIQLGSVSSSAATTNSDANTFKVANANGNFELMNANGNLPADRLASTTGLADGNYRLRLVMASGVPTLEWVAE